MGIEVSMQIIGFQHDSICDRLRAEYSEKVHETQEVLLARKTLTQYDISLIFRKGVNS